MSLNDSSSSSTSSSESNPGNDKRVAEDVEDERIKKKPKLDSGEKGSSSNDSLSSNPYAFLTNVNPRAVPPNAYYTNPYYYFLMGPQVPAPVQLPIPSAPSNPPASSQSPSSSAVGSQISPSPPAPSAPSAAPASTRPPVKPSSSKRLKSLPILSKSYSIPPIPRDPRTHQPILPLNVGIITLLSLGTISTRQGFHNERYIFPIGYHVMRRYPSTVDPTKGDVPYYCSILDGGDGPKFMIVPGDLEEIARAAAAKADVGSEAAEVGAQGSLPSSSSPASFASKALLTGLNSTDAIAKTPGIIISPTPTGAWSVVVKKANAIRPERKNLSNSVSGPEFFGLSQNTIKCLIQGLEGASKLAAGGDGGDGDGDSLAKTTQDSQSSTVPVETSFTATTGANDVSATSSSNSATTSSGSQLPSKSSTTPPTRSRRKFKPLYVWQNFIEGGPLGGRHASVVPALPDEFPKVLPVGPNGMSVNANGAGNHIMDGAQDKDSQLELASPATALTNGAFPAGGVEPPATALEHTSTPTSSLSNADSAITQAPSSSDPATPSTSIPVPVPMSSTSSPPSLPPAYLQQLYYPHLPQFPLSQHHTLYQSPPSAHPPPVHYPPPVDPAAQPNVVSHSTHHPESSHVQHLNPLLHIVHPPAYQHYPPHVIAKAWQERLQNQAVAQMKALEQAKADSTGQNGSNGGPTISSGGETTGTNNVNSEAHPITPLPTPTPTPGSFPAISTSTENDSPVFSTGPLLSHEEEVGALHSSTIDQFRSPLESTRQENSSPRDAGVDMELTSSVGEDVDHDMNETALHVVGLLNEYANSEETVAGEV